ncbi:hypothetical protein [Catellatospora sp. NPDC049133]|jgi:hypothetical protein|uniref:hypothetical protein n=1 Tax=Catellatospora sp. NPDC049133 TaxID=3155499 RepID=UPI0033CD1DF2
MAERDETGLDRHLAVLGEHGARIGRLGTPEQARRRGERRRRNGRLAAAASSLAVVAVFAGVYATQSGSGAEPEPVASAPVSASPSPSPSPSPSVVVPKVDPSAVPGDGVPTQDLAVWLQATRTGGYPLLTALPDGTLAATGEEAATDGALFALVPLSPGAEQYQLKTGKAGAGGEQGCAQRDGDRLAIVACDAADERQRVVLNGRAAPFEVVLGGRALELTGSSVTAVAPGKGTPLTFIIRGQADGPVG